MPVMRWDRQWHLEQSGLPGPAWRAGSTARPDVVNVRLYVRHTHTYPTPPRHTPSADARSTRAERLNMHAVAVQP